MKSKNLLWMGVVAIAAGSTSCSKDPLSNLTQEESKIYITDYDSTVNFKTYSTFSISDSAAVISDGNVSKDRAPIDAATIDAVKAQMQAKGYQLVSKDATPDLAVTVNRIYNTSSGIINYDNYYNSYYGSYWDPYYWGYGGYDYYSPYGYATYSITEGAIGVDILDLKNASANNKIEVVWTGLMRGSGIFNSSKAQTQVAALFDQSPYLNK